MFASSRQCSQRRRMGRCAEAHRGAISRQGFAHLFSGGRGLRGSGDPVTGEPCPSREDCIPADAAGRTTSERGAAILREFHLSGRKLDETTPGDCQGRNPGELYPRVGFIVTNMARSAENVVAFYNKRGNCEQWIKEGKGAIKWTRLSCRTFAANAVRLQLHALAYNLGNFLRTLATPEPIKDWSLTSLKEKLIKIGAKVVSHGRYVSFQMAEVATPRQIFQEMLRLIAELRPQPPPAPA